MKYTFWLGETTEGYEWYEKDERDKLEKTPPRLRARLVFSMVFLLFATYISGTVVSSELTRDLPEDGKNEQGEVYIPVGGNGAVNELDYITEVSKNEDEARINELVMSYIEEQMKLLTEAEN